jgi:outer membrane biosynthesis protein TonB
MGVSVFMEKPTHRLVEPPPIDAQLIEPPVPAAPQSIQSKRPAVVHQPKPLPPARHQKAPVMPKVSPRTEPNPAAQKAEVTTSAASPAAAASGDTHATAAVIASSKGEA